MEMNVRIFELFPGDIVTRHAPEREVKAAFIGRTRHPLWPHLDLVIWRLDDGSWSLDALLARQEVGLIKDTPPEKRNEILRACLIGTARELKDVFA